MFFKIGKKVTYIPFGINSATENAEKIPAEMFQLEKDRKLFFISSFSSGKDYCNIMKIIVVL